MVKMLGQFGYAQEEEVVVWPTWAAFHEASEALRRPQGVVQTPSYLGCLSGDPIASDALGAGDGSMGSGSAWERCSSAEDFVRACSEVRSEQAPGRGASPLWFPSEYNAYPAACEDAEAWVQDGQCWVLRSSPGLAPLCVARVYRSMEMRDRACLAALVATSAAVPRAVHHAARIFGPDHPFACFLAGPGARPGIPPFALPGGHETFTVYLKQGGASLFTNTPTV